MRNLLQRPLVLIARIYRRFRRQCAADASITGINDFPTELLFEIIIYLPLPALIAARTVNKRWRELIAVAPISPSRRRLLDLYIYAIASPSFLATRAQIIPNLGPFDRKAYVALLEQQTGQHLPEDFRTWVLEWPARAVINWLWPGLSSRRRWSRARVGNSLKEGKVEMCTLQEGLPFYPSRPIYYVRKCDSDGAPQTKHWVYRIGYISCWRRCGRKHDWACPFGRATLSR
ncbi:hypothetical protein BKA93DRAFT_789975 [Sparassis latifolia]